METDLAHQEEGGWWSSLPPVTTPIPADTDLCYDCGVSLWRHTKAGCGRVGGIWVTIGLPAHYRYDVIPDGNWGAYQNLPAQDCRDRNKATGQLDERWWHVPASYG